MRFLLLLLLLPLLFSCDNNSADLGEGFSFGWIDMRENNNVYYNNLGLIDNGKGNVTRVKWNADFIFVETSGGDYLLIDNERVAQSAFSPEGGISRTDRAEFESFKADGQLSASDI